MRFPSKMFVLSLALVLWSPGIAHACEITFEPESVTVDGSGTFEVTVIIKWEHRKCELDEDDVNVDYTGIQEISNTGWNKVARGKYENEIKAKLTGAQGTIRVWRECNKKGLSEGILKVTR